jgi:hypothetical protein
MIEALIQRSSKRAPKWFRKLKRASTILADGAVVFMLSTGHTENSKEILWCRVGLSTFLQSLEAILVESDEDIEPK